MSDGVETNTGKSKKSKKSSNKYKNEEENDIVEQHPSSNLSTRAYLEQNVTSVIQKAMLECARKRPSNPLEFIGNYILDCSHGK